MTATAVAKPRIRVKAGSVKPLTKAEGDAHAGPWVLPVSGGWSTSATAGTGLLVIAPVLRSKNGLFRLQP